VDLRTSGAGQLPAADAHGSNDTRCLPRHAVLSIHLSCHRACAQLNAIDPGNLTAVIQSVGPNEPHQLTTDTGALVFLYNQSLAAPIAAALLANKVPLP